MQLRRRLFRLLFLPLSPLLLHFLSCRLCLPSLSVSACLFPFPCNPAPADGQVRQSGELRGRRALVHRVWKCHGARPAGGQIAVYDVLWDRGAYQVWMERKMNWSDFAKSLSLKPLSLWMSLQNETDVISQWGVFKALWYYYKGNEAGV